MRNKKTITTIAILFIALLTISLVSAEFWACFTKGEIIDYCNNYRPSETYNSNYPLCMSIYNETENCYVHGSWPKCNKLPPECSTFGNMIMDITPPEFTLTSPLQDSLHTSRKVLLEFSLNEKADVYYLDLINGRGRWTRVCNKCNLGEPAYSRSRSFKEGENHLQFRAKDVVGLETFYEVSFFVDSKKPKIRRTNPRRGFADGNFEVQFSEENPVSLFLYYGGDEHELDIEEDCDLIKKKYYCNTYVDLDSYDGEEIKYWFELEDKAKNKVESKKIKLDVDTTPPILNNDNKKPCQQDSFWCQGQGRKNKYIYFNISITEKNFKEVGYSYIDSRERLREKRLCSRLKDGVCEKRKSFRKGDYDLTIYVKDKAGHQISSEPVSFGV